MRLALIALALAGCQSLGRPSLRPDSEARGHQLALRAANAHGGLARWRSLGGVRAFVRMTDPLGLYPAEAWWLLDPARNRAVARFVTRRGPAEWRYDGRRASILLDGSCSSTGGELRKVGGLISNFLYWFGVPFKFLDEGARAFDVTEEPSAPRLYVTYRDVGETPDDWFVAELDPATGRVARVRYVSSVLAKSIEFEGDFGGYEEVAGLAVATARSHAARSSAFRALIKPVGYQFSDVTVGLPLEDDWFQPPAGCAP